MTRDEFQTRFHQLLAPMLDVLAEVDLAQPEKVKETLEQRWPAQSPTMLELQKQFQEGRERGYLCDREAGGVSFSRVLKAGVAGNWSIDAVHMNAPGPAHTHPKGEVDLCFAVEGSPRFDDNEPGWTVYGPGSSHAPTVSGGKMDILYFLPDGAIEFHR